MNYMVPDYRILEAMEMYGGGFASRLAKAALHADDKNLATLKQAFPALWRHYEIIAKRLEEEGRENSIRQV
jgi:hypothetical protein